MRGIGVRFQNFLLVLAATAVLLLFAEVLLRIISPRVMIASSMMYDRDFGHKGVENRIVPSATFEYYNQAGFREDALPGFPWMPNQENPRIAVIGDSITLATGVDKRKTYTEQLEKFLLRHSAKDVEVYNFGAADYGTLQEYMVYERYAQHLEPDLVLLQFLGINDFINNGIGFAGKNQSYLDVWRPYFQPWSERMPGWSWQFSGLQVVSAFPLRQTLRDISYIYRISEGAALAWQSRHPKKISTCNESSNLFLKENNENWESSLFATRKIAEAFRHTVVDRNKKELLAIYFPSRIEVVDSIWEDWSKVNESKCWEGRSFGRWEGEEKFFRSFKGVNTISLRGAFTATGIHREELFLPDGHLSAYGQKVAAEAIGSFLLKKFPERLAGGNKNAAN